jgi:hypothetical protein
MIRAAARFDRREPNDAAAGAPSAQDIQAALERIAASARMRAAPQLTAFLRYVVKQTLTGHSAEIKSYTIAVEALGRHPSFDPQADSIVRVEAGRLRHALAHYYAGDGHDDPVVIDSLRGSYVPLFRQRTVMASAASASTFQAVSERLAELSRELVALAAEIEIAKTLLERASQAAQARD